MARTRTSRRLTKARSLKAGTRSLGPASAGDLPGAAEAREVRQDLPLGERVGLLGDVVVDLGEHLPRREPLAVGGQDPLLAPEPVLHVLAELPHGVQDRRAVAEE